MIYGTPPETEKQAALRKAGAVIRAWMAQKKSTGTCTVGNPGAGSTRKAAIGHGILKLVHDEFGLTYGEARSIHRKVLDTVYHGVSSDVLRGLFNPAKKSWELGTCENPLLRKAA